MLVLLREGGGRFVVVVVVRSAIFGFGLGAMQRRQVGCGPQLVVRIDKTMGSARRKCGALKRRRVRSSLSSHSTRLALPRLRRDITMIVFQNWVLRWRG